MQATETYYLKPDETLSIPATSNRRTVTVPLILAVALSMKASAEQHVVFNGSDVAKVKAQAGGTECGSWSGYIESGSAATIKLTDKTSSGGETPKGIMVLIGNA